MINKMVKLENAERFENVSELSKAKVEKAAELAISHLEKNLSRFAHSFITGYTVNSKYDEAPNKDWTCGMYTGMYWLAYELTGDKKFYDVGISHIQSFKERLEKRFHLSDHDVGFLYSPSCVAGYKVAELEEAREIALAAADILLNEGFSKKGGFILRRFNDDRYDSCRTMVDTMMNIPLLLWAGRETGNGKYTDAAIMHYYTTMNYLIRDDSSSFHHYQFDPATHLPVKGLTWQGYSDDSCWSRGHSWLVLGYPLAYSYTKNEELIDVHKNVTYYLLNRLPLDGIPYWDMEFTEGSTEPRDSSAGAISVCGMLEMCRHLPDSASHKKVFQNASSFMLDALIDKCANTQLETDGLLLHSTAALPQGIGIDESVICGDYFYLEALVRYLKPDWKMYW